MLNSISTIIPYTILFSHVLFVALVITLFAYHSLGRKIKEFIGGHALLLTFLVSLGALLGSLFYSEVMGFEPCVLCWWQRALIFPISIITGVALWNKENKYVFKYVFPLALLSAVVALYQSYVYLGGASLLPCTAVGGACSKVYVKEFGYITIPFMSLTVSAYVILIAWFKKVYDKDSNSR